MLKKRGIPFYRPLLLGLLFCLLVGVAPVFGQDEAQPSEAPYPPLLKKGYRLSVLGGLCFDSETPNQLCWTLIVNVQRYRTPQNDAQHRSFHRLFSTGGADDLRPLRRGSLKRTNGGTAGSFGGSYVHTFVDMWPPPDGDDDRRAPSPNHSAKAGTSSDVTQEVPKADHNGTLTGFAEFVLPILVEPNFVVEPHFGIGISHIREGDQKGSNFAIQSDWVFPVFSYGLGLTIHCKNKGLLKHLDLILQYKMMVFFPNKLKYEGPEGLRITRNDIDTVSASILLFGAGYRF